MPRPCSDGRPPAATNKRALTKLLIERAKPGPKPYRVWDSKQQGLVLSVRPTGRKIFYHAYPFRGRLRWYRIGDASALKLDDARRLAQGCAYDVARGTDPQAERVAERGADTFDDLHDRYLEEHAKKRNRSWQQADAMVRRRAPKLFCEST